MGSRAERGVVACMPGRLRGLASVLGLVLLAACSSTVEVPEETTGPTGGAVELAASWACEPGSDAACVQVQDSDQYVLVIEADFTRFEVEDVVIVTPIESGAAVDLTFGPEEAALLEQLTSEIAAAGPDARLVLKVGDEVLSAPLVPEALDTDVVRITMSADARVGAETMVELIRGN